MTKRKIYERCVELISQDKVRFICQALDAIIREESSIKGKRKIILMKEHFKNAENISEEFRGKKMAWKSSCRSLDSRCT